MFVLGLFAGPTQAQLAYVRINEMMAQNLSYTNADGSTTDWVELYNAGLVAVDLGNCSLTDSNEYPRRFVFPAGASIASKGFLLVKCTSDTNPPPLSLPVPVPNTGFGLDRKGGLFMLKDTAGGNVDALIYGLQLPDYSLGRVADGVGGFVLTTPTPGRTNAAVPMASPSALRINEWMADPKNGDDWFEIYNPSAAPVALAQLGLTKSTTPLISFRIMTNSFIGVGASNAYVRFQAVGSSAATPFPADLFNQKLSKGGDVIVLWDTGTTIIDQVTFGSQATDVSQGRFPDGAATIISFTNVLNGSLDTFSPGKPNFQLYTNIIISELLAHTDPPMEDAIEFQNVGHTTVDISGWWLSNDELFPRKVIVPAGPAIPPGGFRVLYEYMFNAEQNTTLPPGFTHTNVFDSIRFNSAKGDSCYLFQTDATGKQTGYRVQEEAFEASQNGVSFIHHNTTAPGDYKFVAASRRTFGVDDPVDQADFRRGTGLSNAYPLVGPIVINEIMYAPTNTLFGTNFVVKQNPDEEFIELYNASSSFVPLFNYRFPTNHWRLRKAVTFEFPPFSYILPNTIVLVVGFNPNTNRTALTNLWIKFGVPTNTPVFGPWEGRLSDTGDGVELYWPDDTQQPPHPDAGYTPYIRADKVNYLSLPGWVTATNGSSLQRKNALQFGNDPINWAAGSPTPGRGNLPSVLDTDGDGMPDAWETTYGLNPNDPTDGPKDKDGDGMTNLQEYLAGTNPSSASSRLAFSYYSAYHDATNTYVTFRFLGASNKTYTVQNLKTVTTEVTGTNNGVPQTKVISSLWANLTNVPAATVDRMVEISDKDNLTKTTNRLYRIVTPAAQ